MSCATFVSLRAADELRGRTSPLRNAALARSGLATLRFSWFGSCSAPPSHCRPSAQDIHYRGSRLAHWRAERGWLTSHFGSNISRTGARAPFPRLPQHWKWPANADYRFPTYSARPQCRLTALELRSIRRTDMVPVCAARRLARHDLRSRKTLPNIDREN